MSGPVSIHETAVITDRFLCLILCQCCVEICCIGTSREWRQAILVRVVTPDKSQSACDKMYCCIDEVPNGQGFGGLACCGRKWSMNRVVPLELSLSSILQQSIADTELFDVDLGVCV